MNRIEKSFVECFRIAGVHSIHGLSTDSRSIEKGSVFAAVKGENFDGHDFVEEAFRKGASFAIVSNQDTDWSFLGANKERLIFVPETIEALRKWASLYRKELHLPIVAIGGSNGKTSTKELASHLFSDFLGSTQCVFKTKKSENSILGTAISLLNIRDEKVAVIEIGIDEKGWMKKHLEIIQPDYGLITTIQEEHLAGLGNIESVAKEELLLLESIYERDKAFAANLDSPWIRLEALPKRHLTYALQKPAQIEAFYTPPRHLHVFGVKIECPLPGKHNAQNLLSAIALTRLVYPEMSRSFFEALSSSLQKFKGERHRSEWIPLPNGCTLFDDCYNANPSSMEAALETFAQIAQGRSMIAVLGDMLDLGEQSLEFHRRVINLACLSDYERIYLYGEEFKKAFDTLVSKDKRIFCFVDFDELSKRLEESREPDQSILLKGSRGMRLERLIPIWKSTPA